VRADYCSFSHLGYDKLHVVASKRITLLHPLSSSSSVVMTRRMVGRGNLLINEGQGGGGGEAGGIYGFFGTNVFFDKKR